MNFYFKKILNIFCEIRISKIYFTAVRYNKVLYHVFTKWVKNLDTIPRNPSVKPDNVNENEIKIKNFTFSK